MREGDWKIKGEKTHEKENDTERFKSGSYNCGTVGVDKIQVASIHSIQ